MSTEHFRSIRLSLTREEFHRLPRNSAYKYELLGGEVWLTPRPRWHHALLDLATFTPAGATPVEGVRLRRLQPGDWDELPRLFRAAFHRVQPFASLDDETRLAAAQSCLQQTRSGWDGPLLERACHVACGEQDALVGASLVTLIPMVDLSDPDATARWEEPPPPDCIERGLGRPHLTWIFVSPMLAGHGTGSALLAAAVRSLQEMGLVDLATTFLEGNESSTLWHWRNGFRLLPHPNSWRELSRRWR
jgi:GNAT superfamily N-acetyltransferase